MVVAADRTAPSPARLVQDRGVQWAPRLGFAWDMFGNGKTAMRGGFGMFYNRQNLDAVQNPFATQAPHGGQPGDQLRHASTRCMTSQGLRVPQAVLGIDGEGKIPTVYNCSPDHPAAPRLRHRRGCRVRRLAWAAT